MTIPTDITMCSGCGADARIRAGVIEVDGRKAQYFDDGEMLTWDCPACGHADSYWRDFEREFKEWIS